MTHGCCCFVSSPQISRALDSFAVGDCKRKSVPEVTFTGIARANMPWSCESNFTCRRFHSVSAAACELNAPNWIP